MKLAGRILYALVAVIIYMTIVTLSSQDISVKYMQKYGNEALSQEEGADKFLFFYSSMGYHLENEEEPKAEPFLYHENENYILAAFEVVNVNEKKKKGKVIERTFEENAVFFIMHKRREAIPEKNEVLFLHLKTDDEKPKQKLIEVQQYQMIPVYTSWDNTKVAIPKAELFKEEYSIIELWAYDAYNERKIFSFENIWIKESDFKVNEILQTLDADGNMFIDNEEKLNENGVYKSIEHDASEFSYIGRRYMAVYFISLSLVTVFVFIIYPRYISPKRLTKEERQKLKEEKKNKKYGEKPEPKPKEDKEPLEYKKFKWRRKEDENEEN